MRVLLLLSMIGLLACGGDSSGPEEEPPFPDVAGVYTMQGDFDNIPSSEAFFDGTLTLTQSSRTSGTLGGSVAITAEINGDVFSIAADSLLQASVSPTGIITFGLSDPPGTWTFTGMDGTRAIGAGRHTLSTGGGTTVSGTWSGSAAGAAAQSVAQRVTDIAQLAARLHARD